MSSTIADYHNQKKRKGNVGIELEIEYLNGVPNITLEGPWRAVEDHSLRNGMEYVTRQPLKVGPELFEKIKLMTDKINKHPLNLSSRTSVHIHRNIQDFTPVQMWTTLLAYWILEAPLLAFCGETRRRNLFCLSLHEAPGILSYCYEDLAKSTPFISFKESRCKYGGQNLSCIARLGSIEYRGMRGSADPALIHLWATTVYELGERAKQFRDPAALMDFYLDSTKDQFLIRLLPYNFIEHIKRTTDYVGLIKKHVYDLADLAYFHDDWLKWQGALKLPEPKPTKSPYNLGPLEIIASQGFSTTQPNFIEDFEDADI
jgi:hypothetical protein